MFPKNNTSLYWTGLILGIYEGATQQKQVLVHPRTWILVYGRQPSYLLSVQDVYSDERKGLKGHPGTLAGAHENPSTYVWLNNAARAGTVKGLCTHTRHRTSTHASAPEKIKIAERSTPNPLYTVSKVWIFQFVLIIVGKNSQEEHPPVHGKNI